MKCNRPMRSYKRVFFISTGILYHFTLPYVSGHSVPRMPALSPL